MSEEHTRNIGDSRSFEERVFARFDALDSRLDSLNLRLDSLDSRMGALESRLDAVELRLKAVESRLDAVELRLEAVESRLEAVESRVDSLDARLQKVESESERRSFETKPIWERALAQIEELRQGLDDFRKEVRDAFCDISRKFGVLGSDMMQLRADLTHVETRFDILESKS